MKVDPSARPQPSLSNLIEGTPGFLSRVLAVVALQGVFTSWVHDTAFPCILWGSSNNKDERRQHRLGESRDPSRRPYISTRHRPLITVVTVRESPTNGHTTQFVSPLAFSTHLVSTPLDTYVYVYSLGLPFLGSPVGSGLALVQDWRSGSKGASPGMDECTTHVKETLSPSLVPPRYDVAHRHPSVAHMPKHRQQREKKKHTQYVT